MRDHAPIRAPRLAVRGGPGPWLIAIVFVLQALFAPPHHHDKPAKTAHCVACVLQGQPHAGPPAAAALPAPSGWRIIYRLFAAAAAAHAVVCADYLMPPAHAPPRFPPTS